MRFKHDVHERWRFKKKKFYRRWLTNYRRVCRRYPRPPLQSFAFKRGDGALWPQFGQLPQHREVVVRYSISRPLFKKLYEYEYHHPLTWGTRSALGPLPVQEAGGGGSWWGRLDLPVFRQAGLPPQHYYTRLEAEILSPLLGFLREYTRFAFSSALHDNYYRKYGDILAYIVFHYPQYTLTDIERITTIPSDFRVRAARGVTPTLPLEIQHHFITEPLQFSNFSASQKLLLTADFAREVQIQAPWLTLMREYFVPLGEYQSFWRELAEVMFTSCS